MDQALTDSKEPTLGVTLILKRDEFKDTIYGTGEWEKGETKLVPKSVAERMYKHIDVYSPATAKAAAKSASVVTFDKANEDAKKIEEEEDRAVRDNINAMKKPALIEYAAVHYGHKIGEQKSEDTARAEVVQLIDRFGVR